MVQITYRSSDGAQRVVDVPIGTSLMQGAMTHGISGIVGECGGSAMCATCHVYLDPADQARVPAPNAVELEMLDSVADERKPNSRLSCQLIASPEMEGLVLHLPSRQV
ncbi:2Fe-2S iron-sulfur cluster-binding protein [Noviherbaspirillum denitrificans]|uniref:Ferredoxin n=1 Tax=Noviherbaspirillum denitrificans TaxID=1968433 RepID=A0A254T7V1_9BURK|nr:2Fe-2S iron-sulfur cluster-binding protein [Noviherbaspirillum denitrificans]OWW18719.1 ferredoxin [Noviherbaspirillum denitrificans]